MFSITVFRVGDLARFPPEIILISFEAKNFLVAIITQHGKSIYIYTASKRKYFVIFLSLCKYYPSLSEVKCYKNFQRTVKSLE